MKKSTLYLVMLVMGYLLSLVGCAKSATTNSWEASKTYFDAWIQLNDPGDWTRTDLGCYVIEETEGTGDLVGNYENSPYVRVNYTVYELGINGNVYGDVNSTTSLALAQQLGTYVESYYYGPRIWIRVSNTLSAGVDESISGMRVGGTKTVVIPGWLFTTSRYDTPEEYLYNESGTNYIYKIEVVETIEDIVQWELDSLKSYLANNYSTVDFENDSLKYGFYYIQTQEPTNTNAFTSDSTVYINYIGRRLDGQVFDTNIRDTAKRYGIYDSTADYEPVLINWSDDDYDELTMTDDESSMIDGFAYALWQMHSYEAGTCVFYSALGYSSSGSGDEIPEYSPLRFDIEFVDGE